MRNLRAYWAEVRRLRESLQLTNANGIYLATIGNAMNGMPDGIVSLCLPAVAARSLVDGTHRRADEQEILAYAERQAHAARNIRAEDDYWRDQHKKYDQRQRGYVAEVRG